MKRLITFIILCFAFAAAASAQTSTILIGTTVTQGIGPEIMVDGTRYNRPTVFLWPIGSKHIVQYLLSVTDDGVTLPYQSANADLTRWAFGGWTDNRGLLSPRGSEIITVTASPAVTSLIATVTTTFRLHVEFFNSPGAGACSGAPIDPTQDGFRYGIVYVGGICVSTNYDAWLPANATLNLNAFPYPGFVFVGWIVNGNGLPNPFLQTFNFTQAINLVPYFLPGKRVTFRTNPPGLAVLVDHTLIQTPPAAPTSILPPSNVSPACTPNYTALPPNAPVGYTPLCVGDFDFLPGSKHTIGANVPQSDKGGKLWVFKVFDNGLKQNDTYTADSLINQPLTITANFNPGARVTITSNPSGLPLTVDGRSNWPSYNFIWGQTETHTIGAAPTATDSKGRTYKFLSWSNNGSATQTITVPALTDYSVQASFQLLPQTQLTSVPPGLTLTVDGQPCVTPCILNRDPGSAAQISAPATIPSSAGARYSFVSWSDNSTTPGRTLSFNQDTQTLTATYQLQFQLGMSSDPAGAAAFKLSPSSPDGFFAQNTPISVTAVPAAGFKFSRWEGDISGGFANNFLTMDSPHNIIAHFDKVPFIPPAGIKNAAGDTPDGTIAPGSIITIYGENLADSYVVGRNNPLAQTIGDVTVSVAGRLLPLLFVSPQQINAQVPSDLADGSYTLTVQWAGHPDVTGTFNVARNSPGVYTRSNDANAPLILATHVDGSAVTTDSPAQRNETITIYTNGLGPYDHAVIDGFFTPVADTFTVVDAVSVAVGDSQYKPSFAGASAGMVGTSIVQLKIADGMPAGTTLDVVVTVGGKNSNRVQLPVE